MSLHPGDIVCAANGITIEVNNTDAEGRLTLADALWYAQTQIYENENKNELFENEFIIDIATLTGAVTIALGDEISAYYTFNDKIKEYIENAAYNSGEKVWQLPLECEYNKQFKSNICDIKNAGLGKGGSITAALFLSHFIEKQNINKWAHFDIAGVGWSFEKENDVAKPGGNGYGVKTFMQLLNQ